MCGGRSAAPGCLIGSWRLDLWCCVRLAVTGLVRWPRTAFVDSHAVSAGEIIETLGTRTGERCQGRRIIAVQDTTEINFSGRAERGAGLGPAGDGKTPGFFMHAVVAPSLRWGRLDRDDEAVVGLLDAAIWTRRAGKRVARRKRRLVDKESQRWLTATQVVAERAGGASQMIAVGDRESDIFALFARRPVRVELVVRAAQDRALADGTRLFAQPAAWPVLGEREVKVGSRGPGDPGRTAKLSLRTGPIRMARPRNGADPHDPQYLDLSLVEAREEAPPPGTEAVHWRLITTLPAADLQSAEEIVQIYRLRWRIEQVFRATKNDGLGLPDIQMHDAARLLKMAALAIGARGAHDPTGGRTRWRRPAGKRCRRCQYAGGGRGDWPDAGGQDAAPAKSASAAFLTVAVLDRRPAGRLELLLQAARTQDDARRLGSAGSDGCRIPHRQGCKSLNCTYYFCESRSALRERVPSAVRRVRAVPPYRVSRMVVRQHELDYPVLFPAIYSRLGIGSSTTVRFNPKARERRRPVRSGVFNSAIQGRPGSLPACALPRCSTADRPPP